MRNAMEMIRNKVIRRGMGCWYAAVCLAAFIGTTPMAEAQNVSVSFTNNRTWVDTPICNGALVKWVNANALPADGLLFPSWGDHSSAWVGATYAVQFSALQNMYQYHHYHF